jgi:hypothetical protein
MKSPIMRFLFCLAIALLPLVASAQSGSTGASRVTAQRPTALPEDKDLADQFAGAAAGYVVHVRLLQAIGQETRQALSLGNWLYFNAVDLSDEPFAKGRFTIYLKELNQLADEVSQAAATQNQAAQSAAVRALTKRVNERLAEGERLFEKYEKSFNSVVQNPDGSFTIQSR